ncbi:dipeptide epimerase [Phyllobacterium brassicacearum]|uniref:Dipeptide epimerase n=1 Tax=Phyllobacterium brassicacearum TaxID=314235 RepID=A0A2P7BTI8_9HYPH|nr:N-acetyl-D-Glu racemase DgcA [Phyllobacterium brassicacearum]PSH69731.1 dipeptide epimerase [Phyllobacterium brassicacearum]TDQ34875.1 L-alanine-DL-glutamate epimerase-like enolase superfamily enzyme [Phyllobacterium brassicacearum]
MAIHLELTVERWPIAGTFTISRGSKTEAAVVVCTLSDNGHVGRGECVPYTRYGESLDSVCAEIESLRDDLINGVSREDLPRLIGTGAARNAIDCALWDFEAKRTGTSARQIAGLPSLRDLTTAVTISFGEVQAMAASAMAFADRPLIKVKVGGENDAERIQAVAQAARTSRIILDANEGWTDDNIVENVLAAAKAGVVLIEQPLPAGKDAILSRIPHPVPICADESAHGTDDLHTLLGRYDSINIKLDKTGGLTEALRMQKRARELGFGIMVGCMVGTSLAMAPAILVAQDADFVDLDGPLILKEDRRPGLIFQGSRISPPEPALWG